MSPPNKATAKALCNHPEWIGRADCRQCGILQQVLFSDLSEDDLESILDGIFEPIDQYGYPPGTVLYHQGGQDNAVFTIREGLVKLVRYGPDGDERIIRLLKRGDSMGLERLLGDSYEHTAIAVRNVKVCRIPLTVMQRLNADKPRLYRTLMEHWSACLFQADDHIMLLLSGTVRNRVINLIRWLAKVEATEEKGKVELLSGKEMASMLGVTIESVSRVIADLKRKKVLRYLGSSLYEYDANALDTYAAAERKAP